MTSLHSFPTGTVVAGFLATTVNLVLAGWHYVHATWGWMVINLLAAGLVIATTTGLVISWVHLIAAREALEEALWREMKRERNGR